MFSRAVITRELQAESRRRANYWIRFWAGLGAVGVLAVATLQARMETGPQIFLVVKNTLLILILLIGPLLTADCISREKREGTLGLLFLTPLSARQIVSSKFLVQWFRFMNLWLLMVPFMMIPVLVGGLSWMEVLIAVELQLAMIFLTLSAGLIASTVSRRFFPALLLGIALSAAIVLLVVAIFTVLLFVWSMVRVNAPGFFPQQSWFGVRGEGLLLGAAMVLATILAGSDLWSAFFLPAMGGNSFIHAAAMTLGCVVGASVWFAWCTMRWSARRIARYGQVEFETKRQQWFRNTFLTPRLWKERFRRTLARKLDKNPLLWLEYRSAWSRSGRWGMVFVLIVFETFWVANGWLRELRGLQSFLTSGVVLIVGLTAASSFQKERESNAFELLLVAPFTEAGLLRGRLEAVWRYYQPVVLTLIGLMLVAYSFNEVATYSCMEPAPPFGHHYFSLLLSIATLPIAGLYFALRLKGFFGILTGTLLAGLFFPLLAFDGACGFLWYATYRWESELASTAWYSIDQGQSGGLPATVLVHLILSWAFLRLAFLRLKKRDFAG